MMDRRHAEDPLLAQPKARDLQDDRGGLHDEDAADDHEQELRLEQDRERAEGATHRQRARVAHEDLGGVRVEPQEAERGADQAHAVDRELTGARQIEDLEVARPVRPAGYVGEPREGEARDAREPDRQAVEPVRQVHGVRAPGQDEHDERHVEPSQVQEHVLEEGEARLSHELAVDRPDVEEDAEKDAEQDLAHELLATDQSLGLALDDLQVVVEEAEDAHPDRGQQQEVDVGIPQIGPEQRRDHRGGQDDEPAHRRRAGFRAVPLGALLADHLAGLDLAHLADDPGPDQKREEQRRDRRVGGPERQVAEHVEEGVDFDEPDEQVVEHQPVPGRSPPSPGGAPAPRSPR
jgi:hypothetical protein